MISYLKGTVLARRPNGATILVNDTIGYDLALPHNDLARLNEGEACAIYCYHHITDRSQELFGFLRQEQKELFELLITHIGGIGPKSALKIIEKVDHHTIQKAIQQGDIGKLETAGIGQKTAEKIMLGLKGKLGGPNAPVSFTPVSPTHTEIIDALVGLGYKKQEIQEALARVEIKNKSTEQLIKETLRNL